MKISDIKNKKDFIKYMKPYGNHVQHILGNYYDIRKVNMNYDMYEIRKFDEPFYKENTKRLIIHGCDPIEKMEIGSEECVKIIIKETRKEKLKKLEECQKYL